MIIALLFLEPLASRAFESLIWWNPPFHWAGRTGAEEEHMCGMRGAQADCRWCVGDRTLRHCAALAVIKKKGPALFPVKKTMPSTKLRQLRSPSETAGDCRSISIGMEVTSAMAIFRTRTVTLLLFILKHRNQVVTLFPLILKVALKSTHLTKTAFRNNTLTSQPLDSVSFGFAGSVMRDNTVFVMASLESRAVFSVSKREMFCYQFALLKLTEKYHHIIK